MSSQDNEQNLSSFGDMSPIEAPPKPAPPPPYGHSACTSSPTFAGEPPELVVDNEDYTFTPIDILPPFQPPVPPFESGLDALFHAVRLGANFDEGVTTPITSTTRPITAEDFLLSGEPHSDLDQFDDLFISPKS